MTNFRRLRVADIATQAGITQQTWRSYVARGLAPKPDGWYDQRSPWWWESTIDGWTARRPGRGHRTDLANRKQS